MTERFTLDRREGGLAVLVGPDGAEHSVPARLLAPDLSDGALIYWDAAAGLYQKDAAATAQRQADLRVRMNRLLGRK